MDSRQIKELRCLFMWWERLSSRDSQIRRQSGSRLESRSHKIIQLLSPVENNG
jgi:hypothetical protein